MSTSTTSHAGALRTAIILLTGAALLRGGAAAADPSQDDQFLALLNKEDIPALGNVPSLIATAHKVCHRLDGGTPADDLVDAMRNYAYNTDPIERQYPPARLTSTMTRFITAAVEAYCPYDQSKIASIMANPAPGPNETTHRVAAYTHNAVNSRSDLREPPRGVFVVARYGDDRSDCDAHGTVLASLIGAVPAGEVTPPNPPQIPAPPPPPAQTLTPPRPIAAPPPPQQAPPPPQQAPPQPQQAEPPAVAPQPGDAAGSGGSGSTGGNGGGGNGGGGNVGGGNGDDGPAQPSPAPPMPPGWVRLAP